MRTAWMLWMLGAAACTGPGTGPPAVPVSDPLSVGPHGATWTAEVNPDLGVRTDGMPSKIPSLLFSPKRFDDFAPTVILLPSWDARTDEWFDTATWMASWGLVVIIPAFDDPARAIRTHAGLVADTEALMGWLQQASLPTGDVKVDARKFGILGHGRGGKVAVLAAAADPRVDAVLLISPDDGLPAEGVPPEDWPSALAVAGTVDAPKAIIGAGRGLTGREPCTQAGEGYPAFYEAFAASTLLFELADASPSDFVDPCAAGGGSFACASCRAGKQPLDNARFARATAAAFFNEALADSPAFDGWLDGTGEGFPAGVVRSEK